MVSNALKVTGHADKIHDVVEGRAAAMSAQVQDARKLLRDSQIDEAVRPLKRLWRPTQKTPACCCRPRRSTAWRCA